MAAKNKTIYCGYRWFLLPKANNDKNAPQDIGATVNKPIRVEKIAMLTKDKKTVIRVYSRKQQAVHELKIQSNSILKALTNKTPFRDHFWVYWNDLSLEMREQFKHLNANIERPNHPKQKEIAMLDANTNAVLDTFKSMNAVYIKHNISTKTLKKYIAEQTVCASGFKWRFA